MKRILVVKVQKDIRDMIKTTVRKAYSIRIESLQSLKKAEELFLREIGIEEAELAYALSYQKKLSDFKDANRMDAEYFQPVYDKLIEDLELKYHLDKFGKLASRKKVKIHPDPERKYKYIEISDVSTEIGEINYTERVGKELPPNARIPIDGGELIISKVRPTRGAIGIIPKELSENVICSSAFSVFKAQSPLKEYLHVAMRSIVGRLQLERPRKGTSYPTIDDENVENVHVPILRDTIQKEIAFLVQNSYATRKKSRELLMEAIRKLEQAIERKP